MKKILAALVVVAIANISHAEEMVFIKNDGKCRPVATLAENIMSVRQSGYSMVRAMEEADENNEGNREFFKAIIVTAYTEPSYASEEDQERASIEFGAKYYLSCLSAVN